jgi:hypothetical protein
LQPLESGDTVPPPPPPAPLESRPEAAILRRAAETVSIDWKVFLRIAAPLGVFVGLFTAVNPLVGSLVLLPGSVFVVVHLYRRRYPLPLKALQGARLGAVIGLLGFAIPSAATVIEIAYDPQGYRQALEDQFRQVQANATDPQAKEMLETIVNQAGGVVPLTLLAMPVVLGFLLVIGGVCGAVAAVLPRNRSGP